MAILKYFERIRALQAADAATAPSPLPPFDFDSLGVKSGVARKLTRLLLRRVLPAAAFLLRQVWPNPRFGRVVVVTRASDAAQVLGDMATFGVVYGEEMRGLGGGKDNVLSVDGEGHDALRKILEAVLKPEDLARVSQWVAEDAKALLEAGAGRIDVMRDLVTRTAAEATCRLFGLTVHDPDRFAEWTMAVSNQLFGDYTGDANAHRQAKIASVHLIAGVDDAIARIRAANARYPHSGRTRETLIDRLVTDLGAASEQVRATIIGLSTAFVPTNTLAGGNIIEVLLERRDLWDRARSAAEAGNSAAMREVLLEAARLNPALSPGLWRHVAPGRSGAIGTGWRSRKVREGDLVLVCIPSALRDRRALTDRSAAEQRRWLMFGAGPHVCWGAELALAHLTAVFTALFAQEELKPARGRHGAMLRTGPYPVRLDMIYHSPRQHRAHIVASMPVRPDVKREAVEACLDALGNPARDAIAQTLAIGDRVQFASLNVIERAPGSSRSILLLEVSGDGDQRDLLNAIAKHAYAWLAPIVSFCRPEDQPVRSAAELGHILCEAYFPLDQRPFGKTGLHFDGLGELSVADIARQEQVARFARLVIDKRLSRELGANARAMRLLLHTRGLLRGDLLVGAGEPARRLQAYANRHGMRGALLKPSRKRLAIADWEEPASLWPGIRQMLGSPDNRTLVAFPAVVLLAWLAGLLVWWSPGLEGGWAWSRAVALAAIAAVPLTAATLLLPFAGLVGWLRWSESREPVDDSPASLDHVRRIAAREDAEGFVQNHILAVMPFKPGLLRRLTFAFTMWGILQTVGHFFRPGFVVTMGTIHKARWFRVPGTDQFAFFSNYDGSWESYLEDFITRAHEGQTAAWSHGVGFPRTRFLVFDGAADGDRFKRWVRRQQRESRFWYSRFPHLTAQQIRNNAMIEDGLARASSDTDARRWLASFGSAQRGEDEIDSDEVQAIAFSGLPRLMEATALLLRLPRETSAAGSWLGAVSGLRPTPMTEARGVPARWLRRARDGQGWLRLPYEACVLFGDEPAERGGATLGLTAAGLERCGLTPEGGLDSFPPAFRMTMEQRARLLGDPVGDPASWRFSDGEGLDNRVDALLVLYGCEPGLGHAQLVAGHRDLLVHFGGQVIHEVACVPARGPDGNASLEYEPFGFRDGISQPVMRGTRRAARPVPERDLVAPGEILLGYRNHQGYLPPAIAVGAERDPACELPSLSAGQTSRYPKFGVQGSEDVRDFGRNGAFLVVRQLDQDVARFWKQAERLASDLIRQYPGLAEVSGQAVDRAWIAARMIGRWPNGAPLVMKRSAPPPDAPPSDENDFAYGADDPRGFGCPLGAHIRRTNPRDSQEPGDPDEQRITNRHRLLRRGRAYRYLADGPEAPEREGLLFMALCADVERQFEFVQRTWINSTSFHGLQDEHDPLFGAGCPAKAIRAQGYFTIPTAVGPMRLRAIEPCVSVRGGAYFFLPSRSALAHLVTRSAHGSGTRRSAVQA